MPDGGTYDPSSDIDENELEDDGTLDASDTLDGDPGDDPLDQGIVPPDRWSAGEGFGTTLAEERAGESLDQLLAEEEPDQVPYADADLPLDGSLTEKEPRAGRLVAGDQGSDPDRQSGLVPGAAGSAAGAATPAEPPAHVTYDTDDFPG